MIFHLGTSHINVSVTIGGGGGGGLAML